MGPADPVPSIPPRPGRYDPAGGNVRAVVGLLVSLAAMGVVLVAALTLVRADESTERCAEDGCAGHGYVTIFVVFLAVPVATLLAAVGASTSRAGLSRAAVVHRGRIPALIGLVISSSLLLAALALVAVLVLVLLR